MKQYQELLNCLIPAVLEAGCDEAGRGCLAGPVFAASVVLPADFTHPILTDSKQLTEKVRYQLRETIIRVATDWAVASVNPEEIDKINILKASVLAMHHALSKLKQPPQHILVDGNYFRQWGDVPHTCIIGGDARFYSIAAASVLAKTFRDDYMKEVHRTWPHYLWDKNKGYGTLAHCKAIEMHGLTHLHRYSFCHRFMLRRIVF